ncbi:Cpe/LpqF family protein [Microbacterium sp. No. 7]|uniref:Cpe/LpqF family protein n=1 Tax=Microbacterium sp. No. 7 TaxID=1714373 RepID=UPI0006D05061|nr:Cpe/LpqF family protein [Microbacterium sp. No. 7]ALJ21037.1 hypothetical protein AOA12_14465 [Microbacterium sp. No. 7]
MRRTLVAAVAALALLLAGCSDARNDPPATSPSATEPAAPVEIPATPVGEATQWILGEMNAEDDTDPADWASRLHEDFTSQVSAEEVAELINTQIRPARPLVATAYEGTEREAVTRVEGSLGAPFDLSVVVDGENLITGLLLGPAMPPREAATSIDEVGERWAALPGDTRVLVTLDDETVLSTEPDAASPLGSIFKLYVLGAVADAVAAGTVSWDDTVTVTDDVRSLPSGELQDAPAGTEVTVREAAEKMISISDNTATDLLIGLVGREAVEAAVAGMGHHDPALLRPFLTTRELFALQWGGHDDLIARWESGDEAARRALLAELDGRPFEVGIEDVDDTVRWQHDLEWFANADDIAAAHEALHARGEADAAVTGALTMNPGVRIDAAAWPEIAFKGGSNIGVLTGSWRAVRADGAVLTLVVLSSDDTAIPLTTQSELFGLVEDVFTLLAE